MEIIQLSLKRVAVSHYKSIKRVEMGGLNNLALLMGRNNAGKSNCLDAFMFLAEAFPLISLMPSIRAEAAWPTCSIASGRKNRWSSCWTSFCRREKGSI